MSISRKFQRSKSKYTLSQKIISAVTAAGFIMQPVVGFAQAIIRQDGTVLNSVNGVTDIWAEKVINDNVAINRFQQFQLDAGKIANMYFNEQNRNGADVGNLVNFVNDRIDINGTVNAIQNSQIGGNLFFLSKEGMAVGKSGVINTGSLYVMTPALTDGDFNATYAGLEGIFNSGQEANVNTSLERMKALNIPLNASGTISVLGTINATGDVKMAAPKIAVGKNVSGTDLNDGENGAVGTKVNDVVKTASIKTGITDFSNFVNLTKKQQQEAGITSLTAEVSGNGDIVLAAKAEYGNSFDQNFSNIGAMVGVPTPTTADTIEATVENYGTITARGDAVLTAEVTNGNKDWAEEMLATNTPTGVNNPDYVPVPAADASNNIQTVASVNVHGDVTAGGDIELSASADNTYVDNGKGIIDSFKNSTLDLATPMGANVMILSNKAEVTVGQKADIKAEGVIDVYANAVLDGTAGEAVNGRKLISKVPAAIPSASVVYTHTENEASVTIEGNLTANGKNITVKDENGNDDKVIPAVNVSAYAEENLSSNAALNLKSGMFGAQSGLAAAVNISESKNNANVKIDGNITAEKGDAVVKANTFNLITTNASTNAPDDTVGATAVNVVTHSSEANITVNGDITAQNVTVDATNYMDENTIMANNALGMGKLQGQLMNAVDTQGIVNALKKNPLINKGDEGSADKPGIFKQLSEKLAVGAAVVVADENNTANVTFGKTADITATTGSIKADADVKIYDSHLYASGTANSYKNNDISGSTDTVTVGAGVVYAGMKNTASVVFADGDSADGEEAHASLNAGKDINITSGTVMEYHRPERIKREIDRSIENLMYAIEAIKNLPQYEQEQYKELITGLQNLKTNLEGYAKNYSDEFVGAVSNPDAITADGTMNQIFDAAAGAVAIYNDVLELQQNFNDMLDVTSPFSAVVSNALGVVTNAVAYVDPNNYANVAASASAKGGGEGTKLSTSGSVTVTEYNNISKVDVGKFTVLNAQNKLDLQSANKVEDVNITGKTMFWKPNAEAKGGLGIGASVNYQNFDTDSSVVVDEGAELEAGDISIGSDSDIFHVGAMLAAGQSDGSALNGMVTITDSDSYNNVIVDSDAVLKAKKDTSSNNGGTIDIWANNNTSVNNAILSLSASGSNVGAGIGVAINNIDVQNTAQIADNDGTKGEEDELKGEVSASSLSVNAETTGLINTISIAGGMTSSGQDEDGGFFDKIKAPFNKIDDAKKNALDGISNISNKLQSVISTMDLNAAGGSAATGAEESGVPSFTFAGAGSVSLNMVSDTTKAVIDGANIKLDNDGKLQVGARDSAFTGAWSGGAALSFRKGSGQGGNTSVAVSGAVGVNDIDNEITALVKDSTVIGAKDVDVAAVSGGTIVAAGLGLTLTSDSQGGSNYSGGASVSVNLLDKNVNANMDGVTLTGSEEKKAEVDVAAYESDVQVTGGVNANIATGGGSLAGGGVTVAGINNNINAGITGGEYTNVKNVNVKGMLAATQVTAAVSAGVAVGGKSTNNAFTGAAVYNGLSNDINAKIDGANITADGTVAVAAKDTESTSTDAEPYQKMLGDYNDHNKFAADRGIDTTGTSFYDGIDTNGENVDFDGSKGSTIVGAAAVIAGSNGNAAGAAINIADIDNDFTASVNNATVSAGKVLAEADADTLLVGVSGGVAAGTKTFGGMGSVTWQDIDNDLKAEFNNSTITTNQAEAKAVNKTQAVNVAGAVAVGKSAGIGATLAYNALDNTTGAYMRGNTINALGSDVDVIVDADNTGRTYGIAAGVAASSKVAINGSVAVNRGGSNTEAVIDDNENKESKIENAGNVNVTADDDTYRIAVVGQVSAAGKAAVGGGVAYNDVGGSSTDTESNSQNTTAAIRDTDITLADGGENIVNVAVRDDSELKTIAVGVAAAANAGVQGAAATSLINKNTSAVIKNTDIDEKGGDTANVTVDAHNSSDITSTASTVAVAGQGAGVGAGVAVNRIVQQTNAVVNGGKMNVKNLTVDAYANPAIQNIGVGAGVAGQGAGVAGSVSVNMIDNDVTAHIGKGANIVADGSVGVVARSDEQISNYSGMLAGAGQGAGVGISVSVNQIKGETNATVGDAGTNTQITAKGNSDLTTNTGIAEDEINNTLIGSSTVDINTKIDRTDETRSGLIVDASSTRDMKSFLINVAGAGQGAGVAPTVNVNMIEGATRADITNATVAGASASTAENAGIFVNAGDYTNMSGFVGSGGFAGVGGGVGLGSDTNTVSREVSAVVDNSDINANDLEVDAKSMQGVSSFVVGAGVSGVGGGVAGVVTVTELDNTTRAALQNSQVNANTVTVNANHKGIVNAGNIGVGVAGVGAGVGLSVGVLKDNSETYAEVTGDNKTEDTITASGDVKIEATNTAVVKPSISATGVAGVGAGVAGATSVNNLNSKVVTNISGVNITSGSSIKGMAQNNFDVDAYMGANAGGVGGVGVGVTVNTIDSTVQTNVTDSTLDAANDIILTAQETRTIKQTATNVAAGGVAVGANIAITNVGQAVENIVDENGETVSNAYDKITEANDVYKNKETNKDNSGDLLAGAGDALETAGIDSGKATPHVDAGYGGGKDSQITVNITNSNIEADSTVTAKATETDNINMTLGSGAAGAAAVNAGVGILNVHRNVGVHIANGGISANIIDIDTNITGSANLDVYQGTAGVVGVNAAVGQASTTGSSKIDIDNVTFTGNDIDITAGDHGAVTVNSVGITVGAVSVGAIVAGAENSGNTEIEITSSKAENKNADKESDITISTDKANTVDAHAIGGAGGAVAGQGVVATASDSGASSITLGAENDVSKANSFVVNKVNIAASAKPVVKAVADSAAVSIFGTAGASVATAEATGTVNVNVYDGNTLEADDVNISGDAGTQEGKNTAEAKVVGNSGSGYATVAANAATADVTTKVNVNVGDVNYKTKTEQVFVGYEDVEGSTTGERVEVTKPVDKGATNLNISGSNSSKAAADAKGITIGGIFSSGNNQAFTTNKATTNVSVSGGSEETLLKSLNITASGATDNTAKADGSGGGFASADLAAYAKNNSQSIVDAALSGNFTVEGDVTVNALQNDTANINADALKATVVGASATLAENTIGGEKFDDERIGGTTNVNINGATITGGGKLDVNAANTVTFGNTEKYAVEGSGYGGVNVQGTQFVNTINKAAAVNVMGSTLTTNGTQAFEAKTTGNINAGGYVKAAGLGAFTWADIDNTVTSDNSVTVDGASSLKTKKEGADITLAAVDNMDLTVRGQADVQGAAVGGASSDVASVLNRNNKITVSGDLYAMNDVNLYAGRDKTGADGSLDLVTESETYNYAALPIADPKLDDRINQNNQVIINTGSDVSSVRNINLYADAGKETIRDTTLMYTWVYSDKGENYTSSTVGDKEPENKDSDNFVQADGKLVAGVQNKQYITIGKEGELVFRNPDTLEAVNNYGNQVAVGKPTIEASDGVDTDAIVDGTFDYGTTLFERYNELGELMQGYADDPSSTAYVGYKTERKRIFDQLQAMNLVQELKDEKGNTYYAPIDGATVDYIELPDIVASGGNINIQTDTLGGSGSLKAQGAPEVVINNNTNLYMKINNITVGEPGGEINFNNNSLTSSKYKEEIAGINADKEKSVNFTEVSPDAESGTGGRLVINGNYNSGDIYAKVMLPDDQDSTELKERIIKTTPRADIEINGIVNSQGGTVEISSAANNIIIQGESAEDSAAVKGQTVKLSASKGSVSQGFQEGIVSIGGNVQDQYKDDYQNAKNYFNNKYNFKDNSVKDKLENNSEGNKPTGNMIAGENIYINASDINVNGKIQSGYADYVVNIENIDNKVQEQIDTIKDNWQNSGSQPLTDAMVTTGTAYRIVEGRDVWSESDECYYRQLDVYYNPFTGQIVVPDVDANGGQVYLTGRISSTGSGSIKVLDGAYDINVTNNTETDLQLGKLVSNNVDGLISIADTGKKQLTEFRRGSTVVKDMTKLDEATGDYKVLSTGGEGTAYNPESKLRYNWTTGQETTTTEEYSNTIKAGLWGAVETMDKTELDKFEEEHKPTEEPKETQKYKPNGEYIGKVDDVNNENNFVVIFENEILNKNRVGPGEPERWSTGFLGWFKWEKYTWTVKTGSTQQYVASVKADKPISIGFIGNESGNSNIDITSAGNINLTNNITSASGGTGSVIDITSNKGAINQLGGSINGDKINLNAATGINDVNITSIGDTVNLNAVTKSGDIGINVNAAYGKEGNVVIGNLFAGTAANPAGDVSLTAYGNITQSDKGTSVSGNRIDLVSSNGAIGTDSQAIIVHGGQEIVDATDSLSASVNAQAEGNINLTQDSGDMRIGRVYSDSGDVTITVNSGDLIDALPAGETVDRGDTDELIQKWIDLGLVEGTGDYSKKVEQDVKDYKDGVKDEFENYLAQKDYYESQSGSVTQEYKDAYASYSEAKTQYDALNDSFDTWSKGKAYYTDSKYVPVRENYKTDEAFNMAFAEYENGKAAFDKLNEQFNGYDTFAEYSEANKVENTYSAYFKPSVTITDEEGNPQAVDLKAEFDGYANYESLKKTYGNYTSAEDYLAGSEAQTHIAELSDSGKTYWDKDKLLYAISDTITNPDSGSTDNVVKDPNIKGNNITINVNGGSAGLNSENVTTLKIEGLGNDIENLKLLASADASTVNWNDETGIITINEKLPIGIQSTGKVDVVTDGNVYLSGRTDDETENVLNIGNINAGTDGNIRLQGQDGIYNLSAGDRVAITGKNLLIQAGEGSIGTADAMMTTNLSGSMHAQASGGIYINQLGTNNLVLDSVGAGQDIVLKSAKDILMSTDMQSGGAVNYIRSDNGTITLEAQNIGAKDNALRILDNGVVVNAKANKANKENGDIILAGVSGTGSAGELVLGNIKGASLDVTSAGNVSIGKDASEDEAAVEGSIDVNGDASISAEHGSVTQTADSNITANAVNASATENILLNSKENKVNSFIVNGLGTDNSINGSIELAGSKDSGFTADLNGITVNNGGVTVINYAENGTLNISGGSVKTTDAEKGSVTFSSEGSITSDATVNSAANINMNADGAIDNDGSLTAQNNVNVDTTAGAIELGGSVTANTGNVNVETDSGTITTTGNVTGGNDVNVTSGSGAINLGGNVEAETGLVNVTTGSGSITTTGNVSGHKDVTLESVNGDITVGGYTESEVENVTANVKGDGNIEFTGEVSASGDVQAEVTGEGDISTGSSASVSGTDITFTTNDGSITTGSSLTADKSIQLTTNTGNITTGADLTANENVDLNVNTGDITFGGNVNAGSENAVNGNITIDITNGGSIKDAENKDNKLTAIGSGGSETAGNIIITTGGAGDVDLYDLYATNAARIDIADGSLTLHEINGELVAMQLRTEGKDMNVENIVAGTQIVLTGSDMTLDQIAQRPDADGMLVITPDNAEADKPIDNFTIGDIKTNSDSGIRFDRLWVNNSDIHISEGQLWFDKLYVEDNAHFSNDEMTAAIYGKPPLRDGSDSVYWINTEENRPESSLDMWLNGTGDWMYLRFTDDHIQESNGILLTLDEYDYVYDQRFTAENHLRWQHGRYLDEDWKQAYGYGLSLHNRYGLIDYQEFTETNAGADEVAVEA